MNLLTAFQFALLQFTTSLSESGVQLYMAGTSHNRTSFRGAMNVTMPVTEPVTEPVTTSAYDEPVETDTRVETTTTMMYEELVDTTTYEEPEVFETTTAAHVMENITQNTTNASGSNSGRGVLMTQVHLGVLMLMCAMLLILILTCCIRCIRRKGKLRTVPRRMTRRASVRPAGR